MTPRPDHLRPTPMPMKIRFLCPSGHSLTVPATWAGRRIRCAACKEIVFVPQPSEGASSAPKGPPPLPVPKEDPPKRDDDSKTPSAPPPLPPVPEPVASSRPEPTSTTAKRRRVRRTRSPRQPRLMPPDVYRPDAGNLATAKLLALILGLVVAFSVSPVLMRLHLNPATAPDWARVAVLVAVIQAAYIAWMLNTPDWASVWVVMLLFAAASALYAVATAVAVATPLDAPIWLDMGEVRTPARAWCGSVLLAMSLATYLCGRTATKWRRTFELERAGKE